MIISYACVAVCDRPSMDVPRTRMRRHGLAMPAGPLQLRLVLLIGAALCLGLHGCSDTRDGSRRAGGTEPKRPASAQEQAVAETPMLTGLEIWEPEGASVEGRPSQSGQLTVAQLAQETLLDLSDDGASVVANPKISFSVTKKSAEQRVWLEIVMRVPTGEPFSDDKVYWLASRNIGKVYLAGGSRGPSGLPYRVEETIRIHTKLGRAGTDVKRFTEANGVICGSLYGRSMKPNGHGACLLASFTIPIAAPDRTWGNNVVE